MLLALSVIGRDAARLGLSGYKVFDERGGVIGRLDSSDWVLRDPQHLVSASHARIVHRDGAYFLEDTSSSGTFINDPEKPVPRDCALALSDGDRLFIGSFEVLVQLIDDGLPAVAADRGRAIVEVPRQLPVELDRETSVWTDASTADELGALLRVCLQGILEVVQAQSLMRQEMQLTGMEDRNPFSRCATVADVLGAVLGQRDPDRAAREMIGAALKDVLFHERALMQGMQAAVAAIVVKFNSVRPEEGSTMGWDRAEQLHALFEAVFANVYGRQMERLRKESGTG